MRSFRPLLVWVAAGIIALTGCTTSPADAPDAPGATTPGVAATTATDLPTSVASDPEPSVQATLDTSMQSASASPTAIANDALTDVVCEPDADGVWSFSGTLTNTSDAEVTFNVVVAVGSTSSVDGRASIEKTVPAGGTAEVRADDFGDGASSSSTCQAVVSR